jgi:cytochrome bd-type quinol oxidase subunit 1
MTDLLAARVQMAMCLGFHIIFAALGIAMPLLMAAAGLAMWIPRATCALVYLVLTSVVCCAMWRHIAVVIPSALKDA